MEDEDLAAGQLVPPAAGVMLLAFQLVDNVPVPRVVDCGPIALAMAQAAAAAPGGSLAAGAYLTTGAIEALVDARLEARDLEIIDSLGGA